jgi:hypothetical protein
MIFDLVPHSGQAFSNFSKMSRFRRIWEWYLVLKVLDINELLYLDSNNGSQSLRSKGLIRKVFRSNNLAVADRVQSGNFGHFSSPPA